MTDVLNALSVFSGIGGFCEGVHLAGFRVLGAVEADKYAAENCRRNSPEVPLFEGDVADFMTEDDPVTLRRHKQTFTRGESVDLLFGGPPCQGFSQIGPRDPADPRNELYLHMCRIADSLQPRAIILENVPNLVLMRHGMFKARILNALRGAGYSNTAVSLINSAEHGVPQERKRVFFLAARPEVIDFPLQDALDVAIASLRREPVTVAEAIGDLPDEVVHSGKTTTYPVAEAESAFQREMRLDGEGDIYSRAEKRRRYELHAGGVALHNHHTKEIQEQRLELIRHLAPGTKANSLPKHIWNRARPEKWRRLHPDRPAHTLMAHMHRDLSEWVHPRLDRWITVREALRLQAFHDGFVLATSEWQQLKQVGNAVPPLLGRVPALAVRYAIARMEGLPKPFEERGQQSLFAQLA